MPDRFPKPWRAVELKESFVIQDANSFPIAYIYFEDQARTSSTNPRMSREHARRIANAFAKVGQ